MEVDPIETWLVLLGSAIVPSEMEQTKDVEESFSWFDRLFWQLLSNFRIIYPLGRK